SDDGGRPWRAVTQFFEQVEQRSGGIANCHDCTAHPLAPQVYGSGRARIADPARYFGSAGIAQRADDFVASRQAGARNAMSDHFGIAEDRRAALQRKACRTDEIRREGKTARSLYLPAGMYHADCDFGLGFGEARQVRLRADDGEGALVNRSAVADI